MTTTYGGGKSTSKDMTTATEKVVGNTTTEFNAEDSKEHQEYTEEASEAENEGKEVEVGKDEETFIIEEPATTEEKEEINNSNGSTDANWEDLLNSSNVTVQEDKNDIAVEEDKNDATVEEDKNDTAVEEDKNDTAVEEDKNDATVEEDKNDATVEEDKNDATEKVKPVKVNPVDGYTATIGSTIQFNVEGDDLLIEGLEGYNYSINNGVLSIDTGDEATVLTVCISNSVNEITFDININGIIG